MNYCRTKSLLHRALRSSWLLNESVQQSAAWVRSPANSKSYTKHGFWQNRRDVKKIVLAAGDGEECVKCVGDPSKGAAFCFAHAAEAVCFPIFKFSTILYDHQTTLTHEYAVFWIWYDLGSARTNWNVDVLLAERQVKKEWRANSSVLQMFVMNVLRL